MKAITNALKKATQELFFDQELVQTIKEIKIKKEYLYNHLLSGRITLEEYIHAIK